MYRCSCIVVLSFGWTFESFQSSNVLQDPLAQIFNMLSLHELLETIKRKQLASEIKEWFSGASSSGRNRKLFLLGKGDIFFMYLKRFIYVFTRQNKKRERARQRENDILSTVSLPQMTTMARTGPSPRQEPRTLCEPLAWCHNLLASQAHQQTNQSEAAA